MECKLKNTIIYYKTYGEGLPIINLHGFTLDHRVLEGCMEPIFNKRNGYKRIYFDLPGMGKTKAESWIKNSNQMLNLCIEFIKRIIPKQRYLIVSESYGSYLARGIIYKNPKYVEGALFICPVMKAEQNKRSLPKNNNLITQPNVKMLDRYKKEIQPAIDIANTTFLNEFAKRGYPFSFDVDEKIKSFEKPSLFLLGRQDLTVGYRDAWDIVEKYPYATFAILDQAGHGLQVEQEELFNALVNEWLDRIESSLSNKESLK
ncbi:MAG: alpha/beta hydrolase [Candidatus Lokiarchaeota archaeon]|nr:alpha/beta hydrolase [Candidatus Lokiarchaeota archaeon]